MELIKERLASGERVVVFAVGRMFHPNIIQALGMSGAFDGFWIDVEHAGLTTKDVEVAAMAGHAQGLDCFVRVPPTDYATVTRCFESGASGVMAAQITSATHAEEFVGWAKFAPRGTRGLNPLGFDGGFGSIPLSTFTESHNKNSLVAIMIETGTALLEVEDIAAIEGVDHLFLGPSDLGQALGLIGDLFNPEMMAAVDRISAACDLAGKTWGAVAPTPEYAQMLIEKGCSLITPTNDVRLIKAGLMGVQRDYEFLWRQLD